MAEGLKVIQDIAARFSQILAAVSLAAALLQCFFGYRLLRVLISIIGFVIGFLLGYLISLEWIRDNSLLPLVIGLAAGALLSLLAFRIYLFGVFLYCGVTAAALIQVIPASSAARWDIISAVLSIAIFVLAGFLGVRYARPCIIIITAVSGGTRAAAMLPDYLTMIPSDHLFRLLLLVGLIAVGMLVQFLMTRGERRKRKR